jgi:hypothetical protein
MSDVLDAPGLKVVETEDVMAVLDESRAEVRSEESSAAGDKASSHAQRRCNE